MKGIIAETLREGIPLKVGSWLNRQRTATDCGELSYKLIIVIFDGYEIFS